MKILSGLYAECEECLTEMDAKIRSLLKRQIGNLDELIRKHQIDMKRKEYVLLVAGKWPAYGGTTIYWPIFLLYHFGSAGEHSGVRNGSYLVGLNFTTETAKKKKKERKKERKNKNNINNIYIPTFFAKKPQTQVTTESLWIQFIRSVSKKKNKQTWLECHNLYYLPFTVWDLLRNFGFLLFLHNPAALGSFAKIEGQCFSVWYLRLVSWKIVQRNNYFWYHCIPGETGSGKSSLINLILGEELLPYSVLSTTSTICELRYGEKRKIVAHFKDKDPKTGHETCEYFLEQPTEASDESYLQQLSPFVHMKDTDREKGSVYKKIELFWPHQLLQVATQCSFKLC